MSAVAAGKKMYESRVKLSPASHNTTTTKWVDGERLNNCQLVEFYNIFYGQHTHNIKTRENQMSTFIFGELPVRVLLCKVDATAAGEPFLVGLTITQHTGHKERKTSNSFSKGLSAALSSPGAVDQRIWEPLKWVQTFLFLPPSDLSPTGRSGKSASLTISLCVLRFYPPNPQDPQQSRNTSDTPKRKNI